MLPVMAMSAMMHCACCMPLVFWSVASPTESWRPQHWRTETGAPMMSPALTPQISAARSRAASSTRSASCSKP